MKLYVFYTPSHEIFFREWFLPSLKEDYELIVKRHSQASPSAHYMEQGWIETMRAKVNLIIEGIQSNMGEVIVHSDVDVQFLKPMKTILQELIKGRDLIIQRDSPEGIVCAGFFACKANVKMLRLWMDIKENLGKNNRNDQDLLNDYLEVCPKGWMARTLLGLNQEFLGKILRKVVFSLPLRPKNSYGIRWAYLPDEFMSGGALTGKIWRPGMVLPVPQKVILHHANWTMGVENKLAQLQYVRERCSR